MPKFILASLFTIAFMLVLNAFAQSDAAFWKLNEQGGITRLVAETPAFTDHIEMSGKFISGVIRYGVNEKKELYLSRDLVWPMLRTIPNNTHGSLIRTQNINPVLLISVNHQPVEKETVESFSIQGKLMITSNINNKLQLERTLFPSVDKPAFFEKYEFTNTTDKIICLVLPELNITQETSASEGVGGSYKIRVQSANSGNFSLQPQEKIVWFVSFSALPVAGEDLVLIPENELAMREQLVLQWRQKLVLHTPDSILNTMFSFAKIRAAESIFQTRQGPMHGPGGLRYYAAIWANDQAEYINPFFPFLGYNYGIESALNAFRHFARFMNPQYEPIPSSIVAEGLDIWNGAGDRGDAAMIAYGASRFALALGDEKTARELLPLIEWCLEYNHRNMNARGVVNSDTDELEGRFPAGTANLCTSSLYYDALNSAAMLADDLLLDKNLVKDYKSRANKLKANIESWFGHQIQGFETYRYYEGNEKLRAWICIPLTVGIFDRKEGTINALFSPDLWTGDGLATESGDKTFWDRSTLYGLRGVFAAGDTERALGFLQYYSKRRLTGTHVPYAVEAFPEGNLRHLSAESALYCRVFTEGLFGIRPTSLSGFQLTPHLPDSWNFMSLENISGFQTQFSINITREKEKIRVRVLEGGQIVTDKLVKNGSQLEVIF